MTIGRRFLRNWMDFIYKCMSKGSKSVTIELHLMGECELCGAVKVGVKRVRSGEPADLGVGE
ncbi:MAG: hypothetical protein VW872_06625, partial [Candidatus Poseidoniales archaeon]